MTSDEIKRLVEKACEKGGKGVTVEYNYESSYPYGRELIEKAMKAANVLEHPVAMRSWIRALADLANDLSIEKAEMARTLEAAERWSKAQAAADLVVFDSENPDRNEIQNQADEARNVFDGSMHKLRSRISPPETLDADDDGPKIDWSKWANKQDSELILAAKNRGEYLSTFPNDLELFQELADRLETTLEERATAQESLKVMKALVRTECSEHVAIIKSLKARLTLAEAVISALDACDGLDPPTTSIGLELALHEALEAWRRSRLESQKETK